MIRKNSLYTGVAAGILGPFAGFWVYYFLQLRDMPPLLFLIGKGGGDFLSALLSLSLLANLGLFYLFLKLDADQSAKGVLMVTILYAIAGFIIKFFF